MMTNPKIGREEARAEIRQFARAMREMYAALLQEGFEERQALTILGEVIAAGMTGGQQGK